MGSITGVSDAERDVRTVGTVEAGVRTVSVGKREVPLTGMKGHPCVETGSDT